ncbi:hypothetical protein BGZ68_009246 [Mortierella alpina]|nr:hypothetical protein BGZ68_009246 [Mortierella alpina]
MSVIKSVLEGNTSRPIVQKDHEAAGRRNLQKLQALYSSCMNETRIAKIGRRPLVDVIQQIITLFPVKGSPFEHLQVSSKLGAFETTGRNDTSSTDSSTIDPQALSKLLAYFNKMGLESIASIKVRRESVSGIESFELHSDAQGPFSEYDYEAEHETFYSGAEKDAIAKVAKTLNLLLMPEEGDAGSRNATYAKGVPQKWKDAAKDALHFASRLEKIHRKPKFQPVVPWEISNISKAVNWTLVLERALPPDVQLPLLVLPIGSLVLDMDILLELMFMRFTPTTTALQIQSYFVWRAAHQMIQYIDPTYSQFLRPASKSKMTERSQYCTEFVNSAMGRMVGPYFAQQIHFEPTMARNMIQTIQIKLAEAFKGVSWIPLPKRAGEIYKMGKALTLVGVGNEAVECLSALEYFYKSYTVHPDDFFGNWIRFIRWHRANTFRGLRGFENFGEDASDALPQDVFIRHDLEGGKIQVPVGMLQPPFFSNGFQNFVNFASIGSMIAQEYACKDKEHCNFRFSSDNYVRSAFGD